MSDFMQHYPQAFPEVRPGGFRAGKSVLEACMRQALDRNEFSLIYQPQISLLTNEIEGFEALLRCDNPALASCPP